MSNSINANSTNAALNTLLRAQATTAPKLKASAEATQSIMDHFITRATPQTPATTQLTAATPNSSLPRGSLIDILA